MPITPTLDAIARPSGRLSMVALDQRESLRTMLAEANADTSDAAITSFKLDAARVLGPHASAVLIDRHFGFAQVREGHLLPPECGLILAADALTQNPGDIVTETDLDQAVIAPDFNFDGVAAIKLLLIWRRDQLRAHRVQLARDFIAAAAARGVLSVLEPVVRATDAELAAGTWNTEAAIREAAAELSPLRPSIYKVQVPLGGQASPAVLEDECRALADQIATPWVVLSQGVSIADFPAAVTAACKAGASGFLAGRAVWSDVVGTAPDQVADTLASISVPRLIELGRIVDEFGRDWREVGK